MSLYLLSIDTSALEFLESVFIDYLRDVENDLILVSTQVDNINSSQSHWWNEEALKHRVNQHLFRFASPNHIALVMRIQIKIGSLATHEIFLRQVSHLLRC